MITSFLFRLKIAKAVVIGDTGVGKTSLVNRWVQKFNSVKNTSSNSTLRNCQQILERLLDFDFD